MVLKILSEQSINCIHSRKQHQSFHFVPCKILLEEICTSFFFVNEKNGHQLENLEEMFLYIKNSERNQGEICSQIYVK